VLRKKNEGLLGSEDCVGKSGTGGRYLFCGGITQKIQEECIPDRGGKTKVFWGVRMDPAQRILNKPALTRGRNAPKSRAELDDWDPSMDGVRKNRVEGGSGIGALLEKQLSMRREC